MGPLRQGGSYLDPAAFVRSNGAAFKQDLAEPRKRIAFSMAVSNTDDLLCNHNFRLAPAFSLRS